jgi:hypothetical protein
VDAGETAPLAQVFVLVDLPRRSRGSGGVSSVNDELDLFTADRRRQHAHSRAASPTRSALKRSANSIADAAPIPATLLAPFLSIRRHGDKGKARYPLI